MENVQVNRDWRIISAVCTHIGTPISSEIIRSVGTEKSFQVLPEDAWPNIYCHTRDHSCPIAGSIAIPLMAAAPSIAFTALLISVVNLAFQIHLYSPLLF